MRRKRKKGEGVGKEKQNSRLKVRVCEKKKTMNVEPYPVVGLGFIPPKKSLLGFFGWCTGGCWVIEAVLLTTNFF